MLRNAFAYITRKWPKSLLLFAIILLMGTLSLIGLSMKGATQKASSESLGSITNSFSMQINRRTNPGTPRGAGNLRGEDIEKISQAIKRINAIADILDHEIIETEETLQNQSPERAKHFKNTLMVTGVNDSSKEDKFVSGAYKLVQGDHLTDKDKNQILMHEDLAKKNGLKVGDKVRLKSNLYDADNEKGANETVEVTIKGLFSGKNQAPLTYAQELYEDTLISDLDTAAKLYGNTVQTATYEDATFFAKGDQDLDQLIELWISHGITLTWLRALPTTQPCKNPSAACSKWRTTCLSVASSLLACFSPFSSSCGSMPVAEKWVSC